MDGWTDRWMDGWMDGWVDGWMSGWVDGWMDSWMDNWMDGQMDVLSWPRQTSGLCTAPLYWMSVVSGHGSEGCEKLPLIRLLTCHHP